MSQKLSHVKSISMDNNHWMNVNGFSTGMNIFNEKGPWFGCEVA